MDDFIENLIKQIDAAGRMKIEDALQGVTKREVVFKILKESNKIKVDLDSNELVATNNLELLFNGPCNSIIEQNDSIMRGLKLIFSKGDEGILQRDLSALLKMGPKDTSYMVKRLKEFGLIETLSLFPSPLVVHSYFKSANKMFQKYGTLKDEQDMTPNDIIEFQKFVRTEDIQIGMDRPMMCKILEAMFDQTTNNVLSRSEALNILTAGIKSKSVRSSYYKTLNDLEKEGYLQSAMTVVPGNTEKFESSLIRIKRGLGCIISKGYVHDDHKTVKSHGNEGFILELPIDFQIYRYICRNSSYSIALPDICSAFGWNRSVRSLEKIVKGLNGEKLIKFEKGLVGRSRINIIVPNKDSSFYSMVMTDFFSITFTENPTLLQPQLDLGAQSQSKEDFCPICFAELLVGDCARCPVYSSIRDQESLTTIRRLTILEDIVNEEQICRFGQGTLAKLFHIFKQRANKSLKISEPDSRGLNKLGNLLSRLKRLNLLQTTINQINGEIKPMLLLVQKDLDLNSEFVKNYIDRYQSDIFLGVNSNKSKKQDMSVVQQEAHRLLTYPLKDNAPSRSKPESEKTLTANPAYIKAINVRHMLFHKWLFENSIENDHILLFHTILKKIPVQLFVKLFSISNSTPELDEYLSDESNHSSCIESMPSQLKLIISKRYRDTILRLVNRSAELGLCVKMELRDGKFITVENDSFSPYIKILRTIKNYEFHEDPPIEIGETVLSSVPSVEQYWAFLNSQCMARVEKLKNETNNNDQASLFPVKFRGLFTPLQWAETPSLTYEIRNKLRGYIDVNSGETPLGNAALCKSISQRTGIDLEQLKYFFKREQSRILRDSRPGNFSTLKAKDSKPQSTVRKEKPPRIYWNEQKNKLLMCGYTIYRHFHQLINIPLLPTLFTFEKTEMSLAQRARKLLKNHQYSKIGFRMETFFRRYIASCELNITPEYLHSNFVEMTKNFLSTYEHNEHSFVDSDTGIPSDLEAIKEKYLLSHTARKPFLELLDQYTSRTSLYEFLAGQTISVPVLNDLTIDTIDFAFERNKASIVTLIKVLQFNKIFLLTRPENYNAEKAWQILVQFSDNDLSETVQWMADRSIITKNSNISSIQRIIPGRAYKLHDQALSILGGVFLRKLIQQVHEYMVTIEEYLKIEFDIPPYVAPHEMVVLSEILLDKAVKIQFGIPEEISSDTLRDHLEFSVDVQISSHSQFNFMKRSIGSEWTESKRTRISEDFDSEPVQSISQALDDPQDEKLLIDSVLLHVKNSGKDGITLAELLCQFNHVDYSLLNKIIEKMTKQGVIKLAGLKTVRYIYFQNYEPWMALPSVGSEMRFDFKTWSHLDGTENEVVFKAASHAILGTIIQKPGISDEILAKKFSTILSRSELEILLQHLVDCNAIQRTYAPKLPIFSGLLDSLFGSPCEELQYDRCYIPLKGWFKNL